MSQARQLVDYALDFIRGLFAKDVLLSAWPSLDRRRFFVGRDLRVIPPYHQRPELSGYHARFFTYFAWLSDVGTDVVVKLPDRIEFTKAGCSDCEFLYLVKSELRDREGVDDLLGWLITRGFAVQVSLSYTRVSGNPFTKYSGEAYALERLFLEFEAEDQAGLERLRQYVPSAIEALQELDLEPMVMHSGHKSYYLVFTFPQPVTENPAALFKAAGKALLGYLRTHLPGIEKYVDAQVIEPKRLLRVPGTRHEETGKPAQVLDYSLRPIDFSPDLLAHAVLSPQAISLARARLAIDEVTRRYRARRRRFMGTGVRGVPDWVRRLIEGMEGTDLCHTARLAIAEWLLWAGYSVDDVVEVFRQHPPVDFNEEKTRYHVESVVNYILRGGKPPRCETVLQQCPKEQLPPGFTCT